MKTLVLAVMMMGCSKDGGKPEAPAPAPVEVPAEAPPEAKTPPPVSFPRTPQGFYDSCRDRVEGPSEAGECSADADCVAAGCSQEMCVSTATAGDGLVSPCEIAPCFQVLDTCTCQQGTCSWTVKDELPEPLKKLIEATTVPEGAGVGAPRPDPTHE